MSRLLALLLILHVIAADVARGFDLHGETGCGDFGVGAFSDSELPHHGAQWRLLLRIALSWARP